MATDNGMSAKKTKKECRHSTFGFLPRNKIPRARSEWEERFALQLRLHKIEHIREFQFALPKRKWRADFFISGFDCLILVEIEGGAWSNGRHTRGKGFTNDVEKYNEATCLGYKVLRGTPEHVKSGKLLAWLRRVL